MSQDHRPRPAKYGPSYRLTGLTALVSSALSCLAAYYAYDSAQSAGRSAQASEVLLQQAIDERQYRATADEDWNLILSQVAGPAAPLSHIRISATFQNNQGALVDGPQLLIDVSIYLDPHYPTPRYTLPDIAGRLCKFSRAEDNSYLCDSAALLSVDVEYPVMNQTKKPMVIRG